MQKELTKTKIVLIGCGSVGMFGTLLMQHFNMDFIAIQKYPSVRSHSYEHWINASSKVLFRQIPGLVEELDKYQQEQKWKYYQQFRYVETLFGYQFGVTEHFQPSIEQKLKQSQFIFGQKPSHIPQTKLLKIMYRLLKNKQKIMFNQQIKDIQCVYNQQKKQNVFILINQSDQKIIQSQYVVICNGNSSKLRDNPHKSMPSFVMQGHKNLMNFININFTSQKLAKKISQNKINAMLHFIYNKKMVGILINNSIINGQFVLQVLNYEPVVDLMQLYNAKELISMIFDESQCSFMWEIINDISVININKFQMSASLASLFYKDKVFLAGQAAHSIPQYGGFGLNSSFLDIHQLIHAFLLMERNPSADPQKIFTKFSKQRWESDLKYLRKALQNFEITKQLTKQLGLSTSLVEIFAGNSILKSMISTISQKKPHYMEKIRLKAFNMKYKKKQVQAKLQVFYDDFDIFAQNSSIIKANILKKNAEHGKNKQKQGKKNRFYNLYAREWSISFDQINAYFGQISPENIKFFNPHQKQFKNGQRLISSDGTVLIF